MGKKAGKKTDKDEKGKEDPQSSLPLKEKISYLLKNKVGPSLKLFIRMNSYKRKHLPLLISGYICMAIYSVIETNQPMPIGELTDAIHAGRGEEGLFEVAWYLLKYLLASNVFWLLRDFLFSRLNRKVEREMREEYFKVLLNKDISYFDDTKTGEISNKLSKDVGMIKSSITSDVVQICTKLISIFGSLYLTLAISFKLSLVLLLANLPRSVMIWKYSVYMKQAKREQHKEMNSANGFAVESFMNIRVIKTFSTEDKELGKYVKKLDDHAKMEQESATKTITYDLLKTLLQNISHMILLTYGGYLVIHGELTISEITKFIAFSGRLLRGINTIEGTFKGLFHNLGVAEDVYEQIDEVKKLMEEKNKGFIKESLKGEIAFKDVSFNYPSSKDIKVYDKLSVTIKSGESVALVGASGSGKSTFVSLLLRLYDATEGNIMIDGDDIKAYNLKWLHQNIGYVSQEPSLFSGTLQENITYGVTTWNDQDIDEAITQANAKVFINNKDAFPKGLESVVAERGHKLSGGQKQRIAIARALIKKPKILIFDEATSALDSQSESQVQSAIDSLLRKGDKTMIIIAHRLSTVINCQRILVFEDGKIVEEGNHQSLLDAKGVYAELVKTQLSSQSPPALTKKPSNPMKIVNVKKKETSSQEKEIEDIVEI